MNVLDVSSSSEYPIISVAAGFTNLSRPSCVTKIASVAFCTIIRNFSSDSAIAISARLRSVMSLPMP